MANIKKWFFLSCLLLVFGTAASAATFTVNSTGDASDANAADNICADAGNLCTLRAAIEQANQTAGVDAVNFDATLFGSAQTILLSGALPAVTDDLTITGTAPALLAVDGNMNHRPFAVVPNVTAAITNLSVIRGFIGESRGGCILNGGNLTLTNVVVRNCEVNSGDGAGISNNGTLNVANSSIYDNFGINLNGGGISNTGVAAVSNTSIYNNSTLGSDFFGNGGGVFNRSGTLTLTDSIVRDNSANNGGGIANISGTINITRTTVGSTTAGGSNRASNSGGGIYNMDGTTNLTNSTVTGNQAINFGGGYFGFTDLAVPTTLNVTSATIVNNSALSGGGIAVSAALGSSTVNINNTIVADNTGTDIFTGGGGAVASTGYNLIETVSGQIITPAVGDQFGADPMIAPLADNGGPTPTHALLPGSPAIDKGNSALSGQTTDQRGVRRPVDNPNIANAAGGDGADIGAFEVLPAAPTAAHATVGGRILTASGKGISRARVSITDSNGETRGVLTNVFGYYRLSGIIVGETYVFQVSAKRYRFASRILTVNGSSNRLNFTDER